MVSGGGTAAQVALAWVMARPAVAAPIASATSVMPRLEQGEMKRTNMTAN